METYSRNTSPADQEKGQLLPRCLICEEVPSGGIRDGIKMKRGFICSQCEQLIVTVQPGSLQYDDIVGKIKAIIK